MEKHTVNYMGYRKENRKLVGEQIIKICNEANYKLEALTSIDITNVLIDEAFKAAKAGSREISVNSVLKWNHCSSFLKNHNIRQLVARYIEDFQLILECRTIVEHGDEEVDTYYLSWYSPNEYENRNFSWYKVKVDNWDITPYLEWLPNDDGEYHDGRAKAGTNTIINV